MIPIPVVFVGGPLDGHVRAVAVDGVDELARPGEVFTVVGAHSELDYELRPNESDEGPLWVYVYVGSRPRHAFV